MIAGMDFGTTNTGAAVVRGEMIRPIPLDPASSTPTICRTSLYLTRSRDVYLGSEALGLYFSQNLGRPTLYKKIKVGEILQIFAELPAFYRDVFVFEDEYSPGRLFLSIKTALRNPDYFGTVFLDHWYSVSDLVAVFLIGMKLRMERHLGTEVKEVVLGRPVHFSSDPTEDKIAQSRLLEAAFKAGFEKVYLEYEPVAAALSYERSVKDKEIVLVFDFGGGTLDFTVMEVGVAKDRRVYATGGIPIAGDVFDQRLFRATIPRHLGENDYFYQGGNRYPIPAHIFDMLSTPQEVLTLNTPENLWMVQGIHQGAVHKEKTRALLQIVSSNYALRLFDLVEQAKRQLSSEVEARIALKTSELELEEAVTRTRFQHAIRKEYDLIREEMLHTLERSGLQAKNIDRVIRTGGSSQIPLFVRLLNDTFGWQKVREIDVFGSVTAGLAVRGGEIAAGRTSLPEHTPANFKGSEGFSTGASKRPEVEQIDLGSVRQRLEVEGKLEAQEQDGLPDTVLLAASKNRVEAIPARDSELGADDSWRSQALLDLLGENETGGRFSCVLAGMDDPILFGTSQFRLILATVRAVFLAGQVSRQATSDLLRLEAGELVTSAAPWRPSESGKRWLCMVTRFGQARAFDARLLAERLAKAPFFQLEKRYSGYPVALVPADEGDRLAVGTDLGRAGWADVASMAVVVWEVVRARKEEQVTCAAAISGSGRLLALGENGLVVPVDPEELPVSGPPGARGAFLRRNFRVAAFLPPAGDGPEGGKDCLLLTSSARVLRLPAASLAAWQAASALLQAVKLASGEKIVAYISR